MTVEEELVFVKNIVLKGITKAEHKLYTDQYASLYGEGSGALICEFLVNNLITMRLSIDYKASTQILASSLSVLGAGSPIVVNICLDEIDREEQLKSFAIMVIIELYKFLAALEVSQTENLKQLRKILKKVKGNLNEI